MVRLEGKTSDVLKLVHKCDSIDYPFVFEETHVIELPDGNEYTIPYGTHFDFASIPALVLWAFSKRSQARRAVAYAVHDSMYIHNYRVADLGRKKARKYVDSIFLDLMNKTAPHKKIANYIQWVFVRIFGGLLF